MSDHFFIVTGGPGAGKTSLLAELARRGFQTIPESGRAIIREEMARGGDALPWSDRIAYAERNQTRTEAEATCAVMRETYTALEYKITELPRADIATRADFFCA